METLRHVVAIVVPLQEVERCDSPAAWMRLPACRLLAPADGLAFPACRSVFAMPAVRWRRER